MAGLSRHDASGQVFDLVVKLSRDRLHNRLQTKYAKIPEKSRAGDKKTPVRKPLSEELQGLAQYAKSKKQSASLARNLATLSALCRRMDTCTRDTEAEMELLRSVAKESFNFCTPAGRPIQQTIAVYGFGPQILKNKTIRQLNKIGRYWGLCEDLVQASRKYGGIFETINIQPLPCYRGYTAPLASKAGTILCFVHAEINLLTFYVMHSEANTFHPRVIGVSKSACYLCNMFILQHRQFFITKTHGRLYPLWNVPDLAEFQPTQRLALRRILASMDQEIRKILEKDPESRPFYTESYVHLPTNFLPSPVHSDLATLPSKTASNASRTNSPLPIQLQATVATAHRGEPFTGKTDGKGLVETPVPPRPISTPRPQSPSIPATPHAPDGIIFPPLPSTSSPASLGTDKARVEGSLGSVKSSEYPIQESIIEHSPFQTSIDDYSIDFEIEGPAKGEVFLSHKMEEESMLRFDNPVFLKALKPGETLQFCRSKGEDDVVLLLGQSGSHWTQVRLRWMPG